MTGKKRIGFIGAGNMAQAIMKGIAGKKAYKLAVYDIDAGKTKEASLKYGAKPAGSAVEIAALSDIIVLAVKPQSMQEALASLGKTAAKSKIYISVAAGITLGTLERLLPAKAAIARVMPNTPAFIGEGACGWCANKMISAGAAAETERIIGSFCKVVLRVSEKDINAVTALSGSGPAYFFYFCEAFMDAAGALGFDRENAKRLMAQTMAGAGRMIMETGEEPELLRQKVTSRGGTTEKALLSMEKRRVREILKNAVIAAKKRADEMERCG